MVQYSLGPAISGMDKYNYLNYKYYEITTQQSNSPFLLEEMIEVLLI